MLAKLSRCTVFDFAMHYYRMCNAKVGQIIKFVEFPKIHQIRHLAKVIPLHSVIYVHDSVVIVIYTYDTFTGSCLRCMVGAMTVAPSIVSASSFFSFVLALASESICE